MSEEHALQDLLFQTGYESMPTQGTVNRKGKGLPDACRLHGSIEVNKVSKGAQDVLKELRMS